MVKFLELSRIPQRQEDMIMITSTISTIKTLNANTSTFGKIIAFMLIAIFAVFLNAALTYDSKAKYSKDCTRYCLTKADLPSESQFFSGIDHYEDRYPELTAKFRKLKKLESE